MLQEFIKSFFPKRDVFAIHSDGDVQEQNKMLADSAEGARREVPQLMQVGGRYVQLLRNEDEDDSGSRR